jgi:hypothetical protein
MELRARDSERRRGDGEETQGEEIEDSDALAAVAAVRGGDVLLDVTNRSVDGPLPYAEHHESGMMLSFDVLPANLV